ncbi:MAG: glycosyltransferase family A protein [Candidatus Celaenobacter antarcticus]|nr:glycosyltransferase family A protein [Candidatus Celaenobacter antarcticus]
MLKINVLVSSMNYSFQNNKKLFIPSTNVSYIIINQITSHSDKDVDEYFTNREDIGIFNYQEKGLSKSRNRAISQSTGDICLIADDDVYYDENIFQILREKYESDKNIEAITFQDKYAQEIGKKNYIHKEFLHNKYTALKVTSFEISFRRNAVVNNEMYFDERFGLGAKIPLGEENIFLGDILDKKMKILHIPEFLVNHPHESTGCLYDKLSGFNKGVVFARIFPSLTAYFICIIFALRKRNKLNSKISFQGYIKALISGAYFYFKNMKQC